MVHRLLWFVCCTILFVSCGTTEKIPPKPSILCGIMSFESRAGMKTGEAESVADMFATVLQKSGRFTVVERKQLNAVLQEQGFQSAQGGEDAARAGKILAIKKMFSGSLGKLGDAYIFNLKMIDVESSRVDLAVSRTYDDDLEDIGEKFLPDVVHEILQTLDGSPRP